MRVKAQLLSAALLAGVAIAQSAPASQTVQQPQQPSTVQKGINTVKGALKNPFTPKSKAPQPAAAPAANSQAAAKPQSAAPNVKAVTPSHLAATQAKVTPKPAKAAPAKVSTKNLAPKAPAKVAGTKVAPKTPAKVAATKMAPKAPAKVEAAKVAPKTAPAKVIPAKVNQPNKPVEAAAVTQNAPMKLPSPGKRDPFLSPIAAAAARGPATNCSTGKHCLVVGQIALKGIVQTKEGNIAMVENVARRSYYLHENDSLFDGSVIKITSDSVTFRQDSNDLLGRPVSKEVVKKVSAPAV
jgi:hypothetical protein